MFDTSAIQINSSLLTLGNTSNSLGNNLVNHFQTDSIEFNSQKLLKLAGETLIDSWQHQTDSIQALIYTAASIFNTNFAVNAQLAFGEAFDVSKAEALGTDILGGNYGVLPDVKFLSNTEMNGAFGAYAKSTNTIYLNSIFLTQNATNPTAVGKVLVEETGHFLDAYASPVDSPGDEGEILAGLVQGKIFDEGEFIPLKAEDDSSVITVNGQSVSVELASPSDFGINLNSNSYALGGSNVFRYGVLDQCTEFAYGRALEKGLINNRSGVGAKIRGNAGQWDDQAGYWSNQAKANSFVVWDAKQGGAGSVGHVAFVERVNANGSFVISEFNWNYGDGKFNSRTINPGTSAFNTAKFIYLDSSSPASPNVSANNEGAIRQLYNDLFGREADSAGLQYWVSRMGGGTILSQVRSEFAKSAEAKDKVNIAYRNILLRDADAPGLQSYLDALAKDWTLRQVYESISGSSEARSQFWVAQYFNNTDRAGSPVFAQSFGRTNTGFARDWGNGSPSSWVSTDNFSARIFGQVSFGAGRQEIRVQSDDGVRVRINGQTIVDRLVDQPFILNTGIFDAGNGGKFNVEIDYYERGGGAALNFTTTPLVSSQNWKAEFFNNLDRTGTPVLVQDLGSGNQNFSLNWGNGSPGTQVNSDNFSARVTTQRYFAAGRHQIQTTSDDGVRVTINGRSVIDRLVDQASVTNTGVFDAGSGGTFNVVIDYYERSGGANLSFSSGLLPKEDRLTTLSQKTSPLTIAEIVEYRNLVSQRPVSEQQNWYLQLQYKTPYFNQRDNGYRDIADVMCNVTSLANCLTFLGVQNPNSSKQFEDALEDRLRSDPNKYPSSSGINARYWWNNLSKLAESFGIRSSGTQTLRGFSSSDIKFFQDFVRNNWEPSLKQGKAVMSGVYTTQPGHIIRVVGIDWQRGGLIIDDPFGRAQDTAGSDYQRNNYNRSGIADTRNTSSSNNANTQQGQDEAGNGKQNFWSWSYCAEVFGNTSYLLLG